MDEVVDHLARVAKFLEQFGAERNLTLPPLSAEGVGSIQRGSAVVTIHVLTDRNVLLLLSKVAAAPALDAAKATRLLTASFVENDFQLNMDAAACSASPTSSGTITIDGGTGAYAGAAGTLDFTIAGTVVGEKDASGKCLGDTAPPLSSTTDLTGTGQIDFAD